MIDKLELAIPLKDQYCVQYACGTWGIAGDLSAYGVHMASRSVEKMEDGTVEVNSLYSPYEQLPSSFTPMAFKFFHESRHKRPYVLIKASPAKLMQGHNVYGTDNLEQCAWEMIGLLYLSHRHLCNFLDFQYTEVMQIDCTYCSRLAQQELVPKVLEFLKTVENGQIRVNRQKTIGNTVYWCASNSRLLQLKCYGKQVELQKTIKELKRKVKNNPSYSKNMHNYDFTELLTFASGLLRWEASVMKRKLERFLIPTNLFDLIKYHRQHPTLIEDLWRQSFSPIFTALEGTQMNYADDEAILRMLKLKLQTTTKSGRTSYTKANNAFKFYQSIRLNGFEKVKQLETNPTFYRNLKALTDAGISKAVLQNLHQNQKGKVIPFMRMIEVDFAKQHPVGWREPLSQFSGMTAQLVA